MIRILVSFFRFICCRRITEASACPFQSWRLLEYFTRRVNPKISDPTQAYMLVHQFNMRSLSGKEGVGRGLPLQPIQMQHGSGDLATIMTLDPLNLFSAITNFPLFLFRCLRRSLGPWLAFSSQSTRGVATAMTMERSVGWSRWLDRSRERQHLAVLAAPRLWPRPKQRSRWPASVDAVVTPNLSRRGQWWKRNHHSPCHINHIHTSTWPRFSPQSKLSSKCTSPKPSQG